MSNNEHEKITEIYVRFDKEVFHNEFKSASKDERNWVGSVIFSFLTGTPLIDTVMGKAGVDIITSFLKALSVEEHKILRKRIVSKDLHEGSDFFAEDMLRSIQMAKAQGSKLQEIQLTMTMLGAMGDLPKQKY